MFSTRTIVWALTAYGCLALGMSAEAQRVRNADRPAPAEPPTMTGKVVAYEPDKTISLEVTSRREKKTSEFAIVKGETKIELPPRNTEIKVGMQLAVWASKDDAKVAAQIGAPASSAANPNPQPNRRPNNRRPSNPNSPRPAPAPQPADKPAAVPQLPAARPPVAGLSPAEIARQIDQHIDTRLATEKLPASPLCDDAEFIRRAYLDIVGVIPPADRVSTFLSNDDKAKRFALIDELLADPRYGAHFADLWCDRINVKDLPIYREPFTAWMSASLNAGRGWDEITYELLTAGGEFNFVTRGKRLAAADPRALFLLVNTEEGMGKGPNPAWLAAESGRLLLGVQLQCAECHDHPFTETWKQSDFWGLAAMFSQLRSERKQSGGLQWMDQSIAANDAIRVAIPATALKNVGQEIPARLLGSDLDYRASDSEPLRQGLARWLTSSDNRLFAQATVNRLWAHYLGRGLVNPVDDLRVDNPPTHPEILDLLAAELRKSQFDLKHLTRCICLSRAYQRTSQPLPANAHDRDQYSHMAVKTLNPGVFYDSLKAATGWAEMKVGLPERKTKLTVITQFTPREVFVDFFRASQGEEADPIENSHGIPQSLKLMNAVQLNSMTPSIDRLTEMNRRQAIEQLYLTALARRPALEEVKLMCEFLDQRAADRPEQGYNAILWILVNSAEFISNH